ncbi:MAG: bifunctional ornithine acetyltransferase/N-acetylglutamate synthase [Thiothrix sp.]|nr:MAG: bifunctional ornithine acetyltransferase/N-acetylglutamate synthase [Thiothrix sp.]
MAVGLKPAENLLPVAGVRLASCAAGIRYQGRDDLVLIELSEGSQTAAVFTQNRFCAAPVVIAKRHLQKAVTNYLLINSGNANAGTGEVGLKAAIDCCSAVSDEVDSVLPFSTGVIGEQLPVKKITACLSGLKKDLNDGAWPLAAQAIMTTDTLAKGFSKQITLDGKIVTVTGIAKGAGMIRPDMATMLAFVATDAGISKSTLQAWLEELVTDSFNSITIDGDTSTNDACVLIATNTSGVAVKNDDDQSRLKLALKGVFSQLAQSLIRDAEGATKFICIEVEQAASREEARTVAYTVAHSPLVKTALFASDPNWGRILAAVGRAPLDELDVQKVDILLGDVAVITAGEPDEKYTEAQGKAVMEQEEITLTIALGRGQRSAKVWTSDLSHGYVSINADYRS